MITIIAQSARIARTISYALAADYEYEGYYASEKYYITWTYGHMVEIETPRGNPGYWFRNTSFPVFPSDLVLAPAPSNRMDPDKSGTDPQLNVIRNLLAKSDKVIIATDPSMQGTLMAGYLLRFLRWEGATVRIVLNDLMYDTIRNSIYYPSEDRSYNELFKDAELKDRLNWLTNINVSRAFAFASGMKTYPISRTSLPILAMVDNRERAIKEYSPKTYACPSIAVKDSEGTVFSLLHTESWEEIPEEVKETLSSADVATVVEANYDELGFATPKLHNILSLQTMAARRFGMDPVETYRIARGLYEKKRISFPGNSRGGISRRQYDDFKKTIIPHMEASSAFKSIFEAGYTPRYSTSGKTVEGVEHGIILTAYPFVALSRDEEKIMYLIGLRMLETFYNRFTLNQVEIKVEYGGHTFTTKLLDTVKEGWQKLCPGYALPKNELPVVKEGDTLTVVSKGEIKRSTIKPQPFNDYTLLTGAMKMHLRSNETEVVKDILTLQKNGYLQRNRLGEYALTERGKALCYIVRDMEIAGADGLKEWEDQVNDVLYGGYSEHSFQNDMEEYVTRVTNEVLSCGKLFKPTETDIVCPHCGIGKVRIFGKVAKCNNPECGHCISRQLEGVTLNYQEVRNLIATGSTSLIRGFINTDGKPYTGWVKLNSITHNAYVVRN